MKKSSIKHMSHLKLSYRHGEHLNLFPSLQARTEGNHMGLFPCTDTVRQLS